MSTGGWIAEVRWAARTALSLTIAGAALFIPGITPLRLPEAPFAAFVAVLTVQTNPGATLRTSADVLRGAILAACINLPTLGRAAGRRAAAPRVCHALPAGADLRHCALSARPPTAESSRDQQGPSTLSHLPRVAEICRPPPLLPLAECSRDQPLPPTGGDPLS